MYVRGMSESLAWYLEGSADYSGVERVSRRPRWHAGRKADRARGFTIGESKGTRWMNKEALPQEQG